MDIRVEHVSRSYGDQEVLSDVSFTASGGEIIGIVGRNGCGKSTLLSILAGIERADHGNVVFSEPGGREKSGYLPQTNPLLEEASVYENIRLWAPDKEQAEKLLAQYRFLDVRRKKVRKLSGGMKRRLAIACALAHDPKLLIMDEPAAALDIVYKKMIHDMMEHFTKSGGTIILVTHEQEEIRMCHRCYLLQDGKLTDYNGNIE
ncbi:MAG: ABC transporter ATP-binding protein [Lachnospiraceae bacterium]|nr:ABC transporter ATP-binding protein [Lachnospiraceae bacterium]